jgi:hypothetical protein
LTAVMINICSERILLLRTQDSMKKSYVNINWISSSIILLLYLIRRIPRPPLMIMMEWNSNLQLMCLTSDSFKKTSHLQMPRKIRPVEPTWTISLELSQRKFNCSMPKFQSLLYVSFF